MRAITLKTVFLFVIALVLTACGGEDSGMPTQPNSGPGPTIESLQLTPPNNHVPAGFEQQLTALAVLSDGTVTDVTTDPRLSWSSSDPGLASVDSKGLVKGLKAGTVTITAAGSNAGGQAFSATAQVEVTDAVVTSLQVTPATTSVPVGLGQQFVATALFSDGSTRYVTSFSGLTWSSSVPSIATISNAPGSKGRATGVAMGDTIITASGTANGQPFSGSAQLTVTDATVTALQVTPATATVARGLSRQYTATAILSDNTTLDVTDDPAVSWSSSNTGIATVGTNNGLATGINVGSVTITARGTTNGRSFSGSAQLTVTDATITALKITPNPASVVVGLSTQFTAIATFSNGTQGNVTFDPALTWSTGNIADTGTATIGSGGSIDSGRATGVTPGTVTITASGTVNGQPLSATAQLTVTDAVVTALQITPADASVVVGLSTQFTAIATFSNGTQGNVTFDPALSWISSNTDIATIGSGGIDSGRATGITPGTVTITASGEANGQPFSATAQLTVSEATVTALQITPNPASVVVGLSTQFTAIATFSNGTQGNVTFDPALTWSTGNGADTGTATIGSGGGIDNGRATGVTPGTVTITASGTVNGQPLSTTAQLTVSEATVTALQITPNPAAVVVGLSTQFTAIATFSNGTQGNVTFDPALTWSSTDTGIATIGSGGSIDSGRATGVIPGTVTITASGEASGQPFSATAQLTVTDATVTALQITPATASVARGFSQQYTAIATFSNGTQGNVTFDPALTWSTGSSADSGTAIIGSNGSLDSGKATGVTQGNVTITASGEANGQPFSATAQLTVTTAVGTSITVTPGAPGSTWSPDIIPLGSMQQFNAMVTFSDGQTYDATYDAKTLWSSSNPGIANIGATGDLIGTATGVAVGKTFITAINGLARASVPVEVIQATLSPWYGIVGANPPHALDFHSYVLGGSNSLIFVCDVAVNALGTPEEGMQGNPGAGGTRPTYSGLDVVQVDIQTGVAGGGLRVAQVLLTYADSTTAVCGRSEAGGATDVERFQWPIPAGERFAGFEINTNNANAFIGAIRVISVPVVP